MRLRHSRTRNYEHESPVGLVNRDAEHTLSAVEVVLLLAFKESQVGHLPDISDRAAGSLSRWSLKFQKTQKPFSAEIIHT